MEQNTFALRALAMTVVLLASCASASAQHYLAARGEEIIGVGDSRVFTMQPGVNYQVVGVSAKGILIQTPYGLGDYSKTDRVRVMEGGTLWNTSITVRDVSAKHDSEFASWGGTISSAQRLSNVFAAFQWYAENGEVKTCMQRIGTLEANKPYSLYMFVSTVGAGKYSVHFWSGAGELKQEAGF